MKLTKASPEIKERTAVIVVKDDGIPFMTRTRSEAWRVSGGPGGGQWLIKVDGIAGGYDLSRVYELPEGFRQWMAEVQGP